MIREALVAFAVWRNRDALLKEAGRVFHDVGDYFTGLGGTVPSDEQYRTAAGNAGVPTAAIKTIWQIETRQLALLNGKPLIRIEPHKWTAFGGDKRDLPKPLNPGGASPGSHLSYSPWCVPVVINGVKCVVVNSELRAHEPMAWDFVLNFAKDNNLQVGEVCVLPERDR